MKIFIITMFFFVFWVTGMLVGMKYEENQIKLSCDVFSVVDIDGVTYVCEVME